MILRDIITPCNSVSRYILYLVSRNVLALSVLKMETAAAYRTWAAPTKVLGLTWLKTKISVLKHILKFQLSSFLLSTVLW